MQKKNRDEKKRLALESWRILSDEWELGNLTQPAFCESKNIKLKTFIKWRQKVLREKEMTKKRLDKTAAKSSKHFLPAHVISQSTQHPIISSIIVKLPNGISLQIMPGIEKSFIKNLFDILGIATC